MAEPDIDDLKRRMTGAVESVKKEFSGLRTGRASVSLLDPVMVDAYGQMMPINQIGNVSTPEARLLTIQVWDKSMVAATEKAIRESGLGLNPSTDGQLIRLPIPELNEERRQELTKVAHKYGEEARIAVRNVRRHGMDELKRMEKDSEISNDEHHMWSDEIQSMTDVTIKLIDDALASKEKDIMRV